MASQALSTKDLEECSRLTLYQHLIRLLIMVFYIVSQVTAALQATDSVPLNVPNKPIIMITYISNAKSVNILMSA